MDTKKQLKKTDTNSRYKSLVLMLLIFSSTTLHSQTLTEKIGGIKTNFEIVSDTSKLTIIDQTIFKRGLSDFKADYNGGYGYGLQTYRLEFITNDKFNTIGRYENSKFIYKLKLIGADNSILLQTNLNRNRIIKFSNGEDLSTISVNLQSLPLIVLDKTERIKIEKYKRGKK